MNSPIGINSTIKGAEALVSCDLDGEPALMIVENGKYYGLDPISSRIWMLLEQAPARFRIYVPAFWRNLRWSPRSVSMTCSPFLNELAEGQPDQGNG